MLSPGKMAGFWRVLQDEAREETGGSHLLNLSLSQCSLRVGQSSKGGTWCRWQGRLRAPKGAQTLMLPQSHRQTLLYLKWMGFGHRSVRVLDLFDFRKGSVNPIQSSFKTLGFATKGFFTLRSNLSLFPVVNCPDLSACLGIICQHVFQQTWGRSSESEWSHFPVLVVGVLEVSRKYKSTFYVKLLFVI